ncbi:MAG TPA: ThuA domain-containing protein [Flavobacteriales bacterium]|nr:ThuA domain-containing protein [Flavobacteriales bacterium]
MRTAVFLLLVWTTNSTPAQRILHFTKTSGFDHNTRTVSWAMFQSIAAELSLQVDDDATGVHFTSLDELLQYDVVIFSNTSGADLLDAAQRANFEAFIANGGRVLGIHAASDTYRHSTANGNNTGVWDYYAELIGASVQENPNHVAGTPEYSMQHIGTHASTANLPDPWVKNEEYYYWEGGYFGADNVEVLRVEETVGPNGEVNSYDAPRPMSWYRELPEGGRVFYTALGHDQVNYSGDPLFRTHLRDALIWLLDGTTALEEHRRDIVALFPNPTREMLTVHAGPLAHSTVLTVQDHVGRVVHRQQVVAYPIVLDLEDLPPGSYTLAIPGVPVQPFAIVR